MVLRIGQPILAAAALALLAPVAAHAEDASVERRLDAESLQYKIDQDGDYRSTFS